MKKTDEQKQLEHLLQEKVIQYLKDNHYWHFRYVASTTFGLPDVLILYAGYFIGLELKREDGSGIASTLQKEMILSIKKNGGLSGVVDDFDEFVQLMECLSLGRLINPKWHDMSYELGT